MSKVIYPDDRRIEEQIQEIISKSGVFNKAQNNIIREISSSINRKKKRIHMIREISAVAAAAVVAVMVSAMTASVAGNSSKALKNNNSQADSLLGGNIVTVTTTYEPVSVVMHNDTYSGSTYDAVAMTYDFMYPAVYADGIELLSVNEYYSGEIQDITTDSMLVNMQYNTTESHVARLKNSDTYLVSFYNSLSYKYGRIAVNEVTGVTFSTQDREVGFSELFADTTEYVDALNYIHSHAGDYAEADQQEAELDASISSSGRHTMYVYVELYNLSEDSFTWYLTQDGIVICPKIDERDISLNSDNTSDYEVIAHKITYEELSEAGIQLAIETE